MKKRKAPSSKTTKESNVELNNNIFVAKINEKIRDERMKDIEASVETYKFHEVGPVWEWNGSEVEVVNKVCWHDGGVFTGKPVGMPVSKINKWTHSGYTSKFRVIGCFCSFACMKAYNFYEFSKKHDITYMRRVDMIHEMWILHRKMCHLPVITDAAKGGERFLRADSKITRHLCSMAPPRQLLLSGILGLQQFRDLFTEQIQFDMLMPPCIGVKLYIEEYKNKLDEYKKQKAREKKFELPETLPTTTSTSPLVKPAANPDGKMYNIINDLKLSKKATTTTSTRPKKPSAKKRKVEE